MSGFRLPVSGACVPGLEILTESQKPGAENRSLEPNLWPSW
jgi:hypothetical protein